MENKELTDRLEIILGCLIGSHTSNETAEDQLENLITELTEEFNNQQTQAKHNKDLGDVSKSSCVHEPMSFGDVIICAKCDEIL